MEYDTHEPETRPAVKIDDPLTALLHRGAHDLLMQAVEAELQTFPDGAADRRLPDGCRVVVRHGHQPERRLQTSIGDVPLRLPEAKSARQAIWMVETRADAEHALDAFVTAYQGKYPKVADCLIKDRIELLTFYDFLGLRWQLISTTNPIESTFAAVRLRTAKTRGCVSRDTILGLTFKLGQSVTKRWRRLRGCQWLEKLEQGVTFTDGIEQSPQTNHRRSAA